MNGIYIVQYYSYCILHCHCSRMSTAYSESFIIVRKIVNTVSVLRLLIWRFLAYDKGICRDICHKERLLTLYNIFP
jgi:hypothetical protein